MTAAGKALPKYCTKSGAFLPGGKIRKAEKRVSNVAATTTATVRTISKLVKMYTSPFIRNITYYKHSDHRSKHK